MILFINLENSGNNREIGNRQTRSVGNCWIPWCNRTNEFPHHHIEIIDTNSETVLWYIWQQGNTVRVSRTGFEQSDPMPGRSQDGGSYNLFVDAESISANDA